MKHIGRAIEDCPAGAVSVCRVKEPQRKGHEKGCTLFSKNYRMWYSPVSSSPCALRHLLAAMCHAVPSEMPYGATSALGQSLRISMIPHAGRVGTVKAML